MRAFGLDLYVVVKPVMMSTKLSFHHPSHICCNVVCNVYKSCFRNQFLYCQKSKI